MSVFQYNALTIQGRLMKGTLEASDHHQAEQTLKEMNLDIQSLSKENKVETKSAVSRSELLLFNQQLMAMAQSGIPLEKGIRQIASEVASNKSRKLLEDIATDLESGMPPEQVFDRQSGKFPVLYGRIIKAGIRTGRLSDMLVSLNKHLTITIQMRQALIEAITYPMIIFCVALIVLSSVVKFIVPHFASIFDEMGSRIPAITSMVLSWPGYVNYVWLALAAIVMAVFILASVSRTNKSVQLKLESFYTVLPLIGRMYRYSGLSRLADSLALLVNSGCDIPEALELAAEATGRSKLTEECSVIADRIRSGENLMEASQGMKQLSGLIIYSAQLGIQRNELADNLYSVSEMYQQQAKVSSSRLSATLTPLLIVFLGVIIGVIVISLFMPLVRMLEDLG